jgi:hypothetical protein
MQVDNECFLTEGRPDEKSDDRLKQQQKQQTKNEVTKACRGDRGGRVFKEMKLFLKGARFLQHAPPPVRAFHLALPPMHSAASALRTVLLPCLDSGAFHCVVLSLSCHLTRSHQYCHLPCPPHSCRQRRLCSATCVHVAQIRDPPKTAVIFAYSWDIDLHVGNEPCQTVEPVVVDIERKEVTTGLNFWFRGKPQSLALLLNTTVGRRQKSTLTRRCRKCVSSCLLMLQVIATNETSTTVTPSSTATANATKVFLITAPYFVHILRQPHMTLPRMNRPCLLHAVKRNFALTRLWLLPIRGSHWAPLGN